MKPVTEFRCPACGAELIEETELRCRSCGGTYPSVDGIIDFRVQDRTYYFNPVPRDAMRQLIERMERDGWSRTVMEFVQYVSRAADWIENLTTDGRYAWKILLDLRPDGVLLDIGCGLGNLTHNLAPHVGKAYAMDLTYERAAFARERFRIAGDRHHVTVLAGGDGRHLPFPDASIDYAVLSGVLEWVGEAGAGDIDSGSKARRAWRMLRSPFGANSPRQVQLRFLREIRRVLKPTGQLFVAIENRTSYRYFLGDPDHHSGLRYTALLPRSVANVWSIWVNRRPYRTYTYSIPGYRRLLRAAGFGHAEFFGLLPGYSYLREITAVDGKRWRWRRPAVPVRERLGRSRYLVPAYGIVAADAPAASVLERVRSAIQRQLGGVDGAEPLRLEDFRVTGKDKGLISATYAGKGLMIRLPFGPLARAAEKRNAAFLQAAAGRLPYLPISRCSGGSGNVEYFVEDRCPGISLQSLLTPARRTAFLEQVESVLEDLSSKLGNLVTEKFDGNFYRSRVDERLDMLAPLLGDTELTTALRGCFRDKLYGIRIARGIEHGDFGYDNVLVAGDRITGVVDWESARIDGIPVLDALSYVEALGRIVAQHQSLGETIPMLANGPWPDPAESAFLRRWYDRLDIDFRHHQALVYLYWLHHVSGQVPYGLAYDAAHVERNVISVARSFLKA